MACHGVQFPGYVTWWRKGDGVRNWGWSSMRDPARNCNQSAVQNGWINLNQSEKTLGVLSAQCTQSSFGYHWYKYKSLCFNIQDGKFTEAWNWYVHSSEGKHAKIRWWSALYVDLLNDFHSTICLFRLKFTRRSQDVTFKMDLLQDVDHWNAGDPWHGLPFRGGSRWWHHNGYLLPGGQMAKSWSIKLNSDECSSSVILPEFVTGVSSSINLGFAGH